MGYRGDVPRLCRGRRHEPSRSARCGDRRRRRGRCAPLRSRLAKQGLRRRACWKRTCRPRGRPRNATCACTRSRPTTRRCSTASVSGAACAKRALQPYRRMRVWDAAGGGEFAFDADTLGARRTRAGSSNTISWSTACGTHCPRAGVRVLAPARAEAMEPHDEGVRVRLDDGVTLDARVLLAADGADSAVRALAGIETDLPRLRAEGRRRLRRERAPARRHRVATLPAERPARAAAVHAWRARGASEFDRVDAAERRRRTHARARRRRIRRRTDAAPSNIASGRSRCIRTAPHSRSAANSRTTTRRAACCCSATPRTSCIRSPGRA